jgi:transposase-like protein
MIAAAAHDKTDERILDMLRLEISGTDIANALKVDSTAIYHRVSNMRKRILAYNKEADIDSLYASLDRILYR